MELIVVTILNLGYRKLHTMDKSIQDLEDRLWDLEEHIMGERLDDGKVYVKRRVDKSGDR